MIRVKKGIFNYDNCIINVKDCINQMLVQLKMEKLLKYSNFNWCGTWYIKISGSGVVTCSLKQTDVISDSKSTTK